MNRNTNSRFSENPQVNINRSKMRIPFEHKTTGKVGELVPFYCSDVLPGDTFKIRTSKVIRLSTPITPFMDNLKGDFYFFFVPNRLVWSHWQNFMGESEAAWFDDDVIYTEPQIVAPAETGWAIGGIADHLGVPTGIPGLESSALPFRAVAKIYDDWFRSEVVQDPLYIPVGESTQTGTNSGDDYVNDIANGGACPIVNKYHDLFTSALPSPQFGPGVEISIGVLASQAPVYGTGKGFGLEDGNGALFAMSKPSNSMNPVFSDNFGDDLGTASGGAPTLKAGVVGLVTKEALAGLSGSTTDETGLYADVNIQGGNVISINELRTAFQIQKYQEAVARGGNRYIELLKNIWGVNSGDARLQRSEYLGGNRVPISVNQVLQTSATSDVTPQGNTAAYSLTADVHFDFEKSFVEHGYVIGFMVLRYEHTYQQGLPRMFSRKTNFDYYIPQFANLGEQGIKNKEIYAQGPTVVDEDSKAVDDKIFGYQEAWYEYRFKPNMTSGYMRSTATTSLDKWHLGDDYEELPTLSAGWLQEDKNNVNRVLTVSDSKAGFQYFADIYVENEAIRPMPYYSIPGLMDHH